MSVLLGYLGPKGTFSEEAALKYSRKHEEDMVLVEYPTIDQIIEALLQKEVVQGIVPLENSLEGSVNITLDLLAGNQGIFIQREIICPITHHLAAPQGVKLQEIAALYSHPQVFSQCRTFIRENLGRIPQIPWHSTAAAAEKVSGSSNKGAISSQRAAQIFDLEILASHIQDGNGNQTRFVVVSGADHPGRGDDYKTSDYKTSDHKTSLVISIKDSPGSLYAILGAFAKRNLNLTRIESRPARKNLGDYFFFMDLEGHQQEPRVREALDELEGQIIFKKMLGSYPKDDLTQEQSS